METIGVDRHKRESQRWIGHEDGRITERRSVTSRERFTSVLGKRSPARVLVEAGTESQWVASQLESLGHEVIVADPNYACARRASSHGCPENRVKGEKGAG